MVQRPGSQAAASTPRTLRPGSTCSVNDQGRFHGTFSVPQTNRTAKITGKFKHRNRKVTGTLRLKGSFSGGCANADSGILNWVAHHGAGE